MFLMVTARAELSYYNCRSILRKGGATRASDEAVEEFRKILEAIALEISRRAALFADDEGRTKVTVDDIQQGTEEFLKAGLSTR